MAQLWMIERNVAGWSDEDLQAAGIRAKICAPEYPNMEWIRSFYDREGERTLCIYRAESEGDIRTHALASGIPCNTVIPVDELLPSDLEDPTPEMAAAHGRTLTEGRPPAAFVP